MARVLRPGGRLVILEITRPQREPLSSFYSLWFDRLVPVIGSFAGDSEAYSYLPNSVRSFPDPQRLAAMIDAAGFTEIRWLLLAGGIIAIHSATKAP
jgi:demethylmenaquinone methyltransferase/2-methoxy-6-polyprenyl-1,4-benzoquinol methylase